MIEEDEQTQSLREIRALVQGYIAWMSGEKLQCSQYFVTGISGGTNTVQKTQLHSRYLIFFFNFHLARIFARLDDKRS